MRQYDVLVIDPPWPVKKIIRKVRPNQTESLDYPTMTIDEIMNLPIEKISSDNSVLFLWTIQKYLELSFTVLRKWGFKFQRLLT